MKAFRSPALKYGEYDWSIQVFVKKPDYLNGEFSYIATLRCESDDETKFPLFANIKYSILNKDKDSRKDFSISNLY